MAALTISNGVSITAKGLLGESSTADGSRGTRGQCRGGCTSTDGGNTYMIRGCWGVYGPQKPWQTAAA